MIYLDTSFIAPLVLSERSSERVEAIVMKLKSGELSTSLWTRIEFASLVARKLRMGEFSATQAQAIRSEFQKLLEESLTVLVPSAADFATAIGFLEMPKTGLRAGDAFHLAIAANCGAKKIFTLDGGLITAGKKFKLPVSNGV
jgi:uncharacterized protein